MRAVNQLAVLLLLLVFAQGVRAGEVIDRIVAIVGKHAILESDLDEAVRFEAFSANVSLRSITAADVKSSLDRLVDQQLVRDEVGATDAFVTSNEEIEKDIRDMRAQIAGAVTDEGWRSVLASYGLTENAVRNRVRLQIETMRMVNQALRPSVRVDQAEIETYYRNEFLTKLHQAGAQEPPLSSVSVRIRQILVERRIGELLDNWLQSLRAQSDVRIELTQDSLSGATDRPAQAGDGAQVDRLAPVQ